MKKGTPEHDEYMNFIADMILMFIKDMGIDQVFESANFDEKRKTDFLGYMVYNFDKREMKEESDYIKDLLGIKELDFNMDFDPTEMLTGINKRLEQ